MSDAKGTLRNSISLAAKALVLRQRHRLCYLELTRKEGRKGAMSEITDSGFVLT
jgi:hypothetical protein